MANADHISQRACGARLPGETQSVFARAVAELRAGRPQCALAAFDMVLADQPDHGEAAFGRGLALQALGAREAALAAFRQIARANPLSWKAWGSIADITPSEDERLQAIARCADALVRCAAHGNTHLRGQAADALMAAHRPAEAARLLSARQQTAEEPARPDRRLARAYYGQGHYREAFAEACRVLEFERAAPVNAQTGRRFLPDAARSVLREITDLLSAAGAAPFLASGTLLGFHRDGAPLAHDRDIDIGVLRDPSGRPDIAGIIRCHPKLCLPRNSRPGDRYFGLMHKGIAVDIFVYDVRDEGATCGFSDLPGDIQWRFSRFGLCRTSYGGEVWQVPNSPGRYLTEAYGPGWQTPDKGFASAVSSPALHQTDGYARAYYAAMRAGGALRAGDAAKAEALMRQSPVPIPEHRDGLQAPFQRAT